MIAVSDLKTVTTSLTAVVMLEAATAELAPTSKPADLIGLNALMETAATIELAMPTQDVVLVEQPLSTPSTAVVRQTNVTRSASSMDERPVGSDEIERAPLTELVVMVKRSVRTECQPKPADRESSAEDVLRLRLELANERVAMAIEREAMAHKEAGLSKRWASLCEERMNAMASDADRVASFANETLRCQLLLRDAERRAEAAHQTTRRMYARICELAGERARAQLQTNEASERREETRVDQQTAAERSSIDMQQETAESGVTENMRETVAGQVSQQQDVVAMRECVADRMPAAGDNVRPTTARIETDVRAKCKPKSAKLVEGVVSKQRAITGLVEKCKRCGDCGHEHRGCASARHTWGRDWSKHRGR